MIVSKTRKASGWATKAANLIPNGVKCNENVTWVSVLILIAVKPASGKPTKPRKTQHNGKPIIYTALYFSKQIHIVHHPFIWLIQLLSICIVAYRVTYNNKSNAVCYTSPLNTSTASVTFERLWKFPHSKMAICIEYIEWSSSALWFILPALTTSTLYFNWLHEPHSSFC